MDYITPLMFGAVGNGKVDDTVALRKKHFCFPFFWNSNSYPQWLYILCYGAY